MDNWSGMPGSRSVLIRYGVGAEFLNLTIDITFKIWYTYAVFEENITEINHKIPNNIL